MKNRVNKNEYFDLMQSFMDTRIRAKEERLVINLDNYDLIVVKKGKDNGNIKK